MQPPKALMQLVDFIVNSPFPANADFLQCVWD